MFDPRRPPHHPQIAAALGRVRRALAEAGLGPGPHTLLLACSGGADSIATLGLLALLRYSEDLRLAVGHVDHGLRPSAEAEAEQVRAIASALDLRVQVTRIELAPGLGLPARAREARRAALLAQARRLDAGRVVLAHSATDQAETMLMHLARGCGLDGLAAMAVDDPPWLRPVLSLTRAELRELATRLDLPFVDDPSNEDRQQLRPWLRHVVLAPLREQNPGLERGFATLAAQARDAEDALDAWARREVEARGIGEEQKPKDGVEDPGGERGLAWILDGFDTLPRAIRTRALRHMCARGGIDLAQLRARILDALDEAAVAVARSQGPNRPRPRPRVWDLHPNKRLKISKNGVFVESSPRHGEVEGL